MVLLRELRIGSGSYENLERRRTTEALLSQANAERFVAFRDGDAQAHVCADLHLDRMRSRAAIDILVGRAVLRAIEAQDRAMFRIAELEEKGETQSVTLNRLRETVRSLNALLRDLGV